jgi:hypothetical protein
MFPQGPPRGLRIAVIVWFVWPLAMLAVVAWSPVLFVVMVIAWFAALGVIVRLSRRESQRQREELREESPPSDLGNEAVNKDARDRRGAVPGGPRAIQQRLLLSALVIGLFVSIFFVSGAAIFWLAGCALAVAVGGEIAIARSTARREGSSAPSND